MKIGVTGPVRSGKSTAVTVLLESLQKRYKHIVHIDLDKIGHLLLKDPEIIQLFTKTFSRSVLRDSHIDRKKLAEYAFESVESYGRLTSIMYPRIKETVSRRIERLPDKTCTIIDGAVIKEAGLDLICDELLVVVPNAGQIWKNYSMYKQRRKFQLSNEEYSKMSPNIIENSYDSLFKDKILQWLNNN